MSKNELIERAVLKFNGEWPTEEFEFVDTSRWDEAIIYCIRPDKEASVDPGEIHCGGTGFDPHHYELICTRGTFNAAANRMRGKPDWSELPPETEWLGQDRCGKWKPMVGPKPTTERGYWMTHHHLMPQPRGMVIGDWRNTLEKRPEKSISLESDRFGIMPPVNKNEGCSMPAPAKPWFEAGEFPPAGTECEVLTCGVWYKTKIVGMNDNMCVYVSNGFEQVPYNGESYPENFRHIKTERERFIDAAVAASDSFGVTWVADTAGLLFDAGFRAPDQK